MGVSDQKPNDAISRLCAMAGENDPRSAMITMARRTLLDYGRTAMPMNVRDLCGFRKMRIYEQYLANCDARLTLLRDGYIVEVHKEHGVGRQNFSLCHEIGHTFFSNDPSELVGTEFLCSPFKNQGGDKIEHLCDLAATELLMSSDVFERVTSDFRPSLASARMIAAQFGTSLESTLLRILELDLWQCCLLRFSHQRAKGPSQDLDREGWKPSVTLGRTFFSIVGIISEVEKILRGEGYGVNFLRRLGATGEKVRFAVPGLGRSVFLESYSCTLKSVDRFYVLVIFGERGSEKERNSEIRLLDHENELELV